MKPDHIELARKAFDRLNKYIRIVCAFDTHQLDIYLSGADLRQIIDEEAEQAIKIVTREAMRLQVRVTLAELQEYGVDVSSIELPEPADTETTDWLSGFANNLGVLASRDRKPTEETADA